VGGKRTTVRGVGAGRWLVPAVDAALFYLRANMPGCSDAV
jgi:hypothetical protein